MDRFINKLYSVVLPFLPVLILYGLPLSYMSKLTLADIILLLLAFFKVIVLINKLINKRVVKLDISAFCLMLYILTQPLLLSFYTDSVFIDWGDAIGTSFRLAFYIAIYCILFYDAVDKRSVIASFRVLGCISVIYGTLQFIVANLFGISLSPYIPFLYVTRTGLEAQQSSWMKAGWLVRARSFFSEPAAFSVFLLVALCIELTLIYEHKQKYKQNLLKLMYILGIMVSCSSTGFVGLVFLYILYVLFVNKLSRRGIGIIILLTFLLIFAAVKIGYVDFVLNHAFAGGKGLQHQSHFSDILIVFQNKINFWEMLFGHGMQDIMNGNIGLYIPGWHRTFHDLGVFGVMFYMLFFFAVFRKLNKNRRLIIVLFIFLNIGTECMLGIYFILYMTVATMGHKKTRYFRLSKDSIVGRD